MTRPALPPCRSEPQTAGSTSDWAGLSHTEWLSSLKRGDSAPIRNGAEMMKPAMVTNETPQYVFVGKLKFWRGHGWQVQRQAKRVFGMRLRLARTQDELT